MLRHASTRAGSGAATAAASFDIYRASVAVEGEGWTAALQNALAGVKAGGSQPVQVFITRAANSAASATVTLTVTSESDPTKTETVKYTIK